jgi:hypothetical protein
MERRDFLKIAFGAAAGAAAFAATAEAAPLAPHPLNEDAAMPPRAQAQPAVTSGEEAARLKPEEVRWHHRHWGWHHRRHWGWRRRWHRRHWRRHWRRRYW